MPCGAACRTMSPAGRGALTTILGVLVLSTDALLIRLIEGGALQVVFWRSLLMIPGFGAMLIWRHGVAGLGRLMRPDRSSLLAALLFTGSTLCFIGAIKHTLAANALFIVATVPLSAALISRVALGESIRRETWLSIAGALAGMAIILGGAAGAGSMFGNLLACAVTLFLGGYLTVLRSGTVGSVLVPLCLSGVFSALCALMLSGGQIAIPMSSFPLALVLGLVVIPISFTLISLGPRTLSAADVGLIMLLEALFGPLWIWLVLGETPGSSTLLGGAVVIGSLAMRALLARRNAQVRLSADC